MQRHALLRILTSFLLLTTLYLPIHSEPEDTWANWDRRWDRAFKDIPSNSLPGRTMGIVVPSDSRMDLLPMSAFGYELLTRGAFHSVVILMQAPENYDLDGLAVPSLEILDTSFGSFKVDMYLREQLQNGTKPITIDPNLFVTGIPPVLIRQLSGLKFVLKNDIKNLRVLPVYAKFKDLNSQVKDYAPFLVDRIREFGVDDDVVFIITSNLTKTTSEDSLIQTDAPILKAIRELDVEAMMAPKLPEVSHDDFSSLVLGVLTMRWMGSDHAEIFAYSHSGQLVLTKDKKSPISYVTAGFASKPPSAPKVKHVQQEKIAGIFGELLRSDLMALTRQTCLSTVDTTAAKPPAINNPEAGKRWPVYVSIFDPQGKLAGQAGTHVPLAPLEESVRKYTFEATRRAQPELTKANAASYVIEISIPYGFEKVSRPDDLIPLLNGIVVEQRLKTQAIHPDSWRVYPDPHQLLSVISVRLGSNPWDYALTSSHLDSFRVLSFNEKEPFQDLGSSKKKKKKKGDALDDLGDDSGGGGSAGGFGF